MRGRVGWEPQFFGPAAKAGDPYPARLRAPSRAPWRTAQVLGSGPGGGSCCVSVGTEPSQAQRACPEACVGVGASLQPATPVPRGPWVGRPIWAGAWSGFSLCPEGRGRANGPGPA